MAGELAGRAALVTGAASGMGRVMARALAAAGAEVAGADVNSAGLAEESAAPAYGGRLLTLTADVSNAGEARRAVDKAAAAFGRLDILVNCAGINMAVAAKPGEGRAAFFAADPDGYLRILAINMGGAFLMARFAVPHMVASGWGRVINVTTSFDTMLAGGLSGYGSAKAALEASTASWAKDLAGTGVTCNVLVPGGPTDTAFFPPGMRRPPVLIDPQVMAAPAVWLASPASDGETGQRFVARDWDTSLPPHEAAARVRAPAAWPALAEGAQATRGVAI